MNFDFKELLVDLCRFQVRFLVVGGYAVMLRRDVSQRAPVHEGPRSLERAGSSAGELSESPDLDQ
jgi:hypothetical protein